MSGVGGDGGVTRVDGATPPLPAPPRPPARVHSSGRRVRLGDVRPDGRARLDALARYLQDAAADDVRDAGMADEPRWVVRRTYLELHRRPRYDETLELRTWCSGTGAAWAERRTSLEGAAGGRVEAVSLWVSLDPATMRPSAPGERFGAVYGASARGRSVRARLLHPPAPEGADRLDGPGRGEPGEVGERPWALRAADFDVLGHVNNAVAWCLLEEELGAAASGRRVRSAEVEYREPIGRQGVLTVRRAFGEGELRMWAAPEGGPVGLTGLARVEPLPAR